MLAGSQDEQRLCSYGLARIHCMAMEDVVGGNGVGRILRLAKLGHLIGNYPPDTLDHGFPFQDFAAVNQVVEDVHGARGAEGLCVRAGKAVFRHAVEDLALSLVVSDPGFGPLPSAMRVEAGLASPSEAFMHLGDQVTYLVGDETRLVCVISECPICAGRTSDAPICYGVTGMLQDALHWLRGSRNFSVVEMECTAKGDPSCRVVIRRGGREWLHRGLKSLSSKRTTLLPHKGRGVEMGGALPR